MIGVPQLPSVYQRLCIFNRWCCGSGVFKQQSRVIAPDGSVILEGKPVKIKLDDDAKTATSVEFFMNARMNVAGRYWVEVLIDGTLKLRYPLHVKYVPPKGSKTP